MTLLKVIDNIMTCNFTVFYIVNMYLMKSKGFLKQHFIFIFFILQCCFIEIKYDHIMKICHVLERKIKVILSWFELSDW